MDLLALASRHRDWLAVRQATIAENISNSDTPGFSAGKVHSFADTVRNIGEGLGTATSHPDHLSGSDQGRATPMVGHQDTGIVSHSGNTVRVEDELLEAGAVKREYALNTSITHTFRRMLAASMKV